MLTLLILVAFGYFAVMLWLWYLRRKLPRPTLVLLWLDGLPAAGLAKYAEQMPHCRIYVGGNDRKLLQCLAAFYHYDYYRGNLAEAEKYFEKIIKC